MGRKGCDIIVNKDKGVSRVHAEVIVDEMICVDHLQKRQSNNSFQVRIRDCSKYGTFISQNVGSKEKVHEFPNKETQLKDGDLVSFGTGTASYRFSFVPLIFFVASSAMMQLQDKISLIGASITQTWTSGCTHMVADDLLLIDNEVIDAIVARKPIVKFSWLEVIAGKTICTEIPSFLVHSPTFTVEGVSLKVTDPQSREYCLKGFTFLLQSIDKYKFKEKFQLLLEVGGAKVIEIPDPYVQYLEDNLVYVMPAGSSSNTERSNNFNSLPKVKEMELISAVVCGHLDPSIMASAPVLVTSSCSTDETVVADSDLEMEAATSISKPTSVNLMESAEDESQRKMKIHKIESSENDSIAEDKHHIVESIKHDSAANTDATKTTICESHDVLLHPNWSTDPVGPCQPVAKTNNGDYTWSRETNDRIMMKKDRDHSSESETLDVIYSQNLIVRDLPLPQCGRSLASGSAINFKCFRKRNTPSGNSFHNLVPFSKQPYEESDYGNEDVAKSVKEEKKRKQMEAIAEDLFHNEKGRKRGTSGSLVGLLARR